MRIPELYGFLITAIVYFIIIKEYRFNRKVNKRTEEINDKYNEK